MQLTLNEVPCYQTDSQPSQSALSQAAVGLLNYLGENVDAWCGCGAAAPASPGRGACRCAR